jgi:hypothetical protein
MWTNGFCETNVQKTCADGIANRDWLWQAKSLNLTSGFTFDFSYCRHNGWMRKRTREVRACARGGSGGDDVLVRECSARVGTDRAMLAAARSWCAKASKHSTPRPRRSARCSTRR